MTELCSICYEQGVKDMEEAMNMHPRIYKPMIQWVKEKAEEVCTEWNGIGSIEAENVLEKLFLRPNQPNE